MKAVRMKPTRSHTEEIEKTPVKPNVFLKALVTFLILATLYFAFPVPLAYVVERPAVLLSNHRPPPQWFLDGLQVAFAPALWLAEHSEPYDDYLTWWVSVMPPPNR